jgi:hypothetical protein
MICRDILHIIYNKMLMLDRLTMYAVLEEPRPSQFEVGINLMREHELEDKIKGTKGFAMYQLSSCLHSRESWFIDVPWKYDRGIYII